MWDPHSGNPLFWPSKAYISFIFINHVILNETGVRPSTLVCKLVPLRNHNNVIIHINVQDILFGPFMFIKDLKDSHKIFNVARSLFTFQNQMQ